MKTHQDIPMSQGEGILIKAKLTDKDTKGPLVLTTAVLKWTLTDPNNDVVQVTKETTDIEIVSDGTKEGAEYSEVWVGPLLIEDTETLLGEYRQELSSLDGTEWVVLMKGTITIGKSDGL
jgi:hypothetical protein